MDEQIDVAERFNAERAHLHAVAYRMLGSQAEADDAVQEAWIRLNRADAKTIDNLAAWLTTVVARVCLDMLRSRKARAEAPELEDDGANEALEALGALGPDEELALADTMGPALMLVLEILSPGERVAFVLHDLFGISFDDIAHVLGRTSMATRQLATRARRRIQGANPSGEPANRERERAVVTAFLTASRRGSFEALLAVLAPDVVTRADAFAARMGSEPEMRGADAVATFFKGRARAARLALVDGAPSAVWIHNGKVRVVFRFTIAGDVVSALDLVAEPAILERLEIVLLEDEFVDTSTN